MPAPLPGAPVFPIAGNHGGADNAGCPCATNAAAAGADIGGIVTRGSPNARTSGAKGFSHQITRPAPQPASNSTSMISGPPRAGR
ncbi:MAG: hypothetical protein EAY70_01975 [Sphingomonadales bacterium]|nr:MAG: hypothetical protein EAY70_01975 [Sphingomonadales bacterium]